MNHNEPRLATTNESNDEEGDDAWLADEVARLDLEASRDLDAYHPQFMDTEAMHSLRRELHTSEARVQSQGHMREFVPRKPILTYRSPTQPRRRRVEQRTESVETTTDDPFVLHEPHKREYATAVREEVDQLRALAEQYDDMKCMLLDHLDVICSTKPTERTNSHEVYDKLENLLAFAAQCAVSTEENERG